MRFASSNSASFSREDLLKILVSYVQLQGFAIHPSNARITPALGSTGALVTLTWDNPDWVGEAPAAQTGAPAQSLRPEPVQPPPPQNILPTSAQYLDDIERGFDRPDSRQPYK